MIEFILMNAILTRNPHQKAASLTLQTVRNGHRGPHARGGLLHNCQTQPGTEGIASCTTVKAFKFPFAKELGLLGGFAESGFTPQSMTAIVAIK